MPAAPLDRPAKHTVLHELSAGIRAPSGPVFAALARRLEPGDSSSLRYTADEVTGRVVIQGPWWYRAEYLVQRDAEGCLVEHVLVNVAQFGERAALVAGARVAADAPLAFHALVRGLRAELE